MDPSLQAFCDRFVKWRHVAPLQKLLDTLRPPFRCPTGHPGLDSRLIRDSRAEVLRFRWLRALGPPSCRISVQKTQKFQKESSTRTPHCMHEVRSCFSETKHRTKIRIMLIGVANAGLQGLPAGRRSGKAFCDLNRAGNPEEPDDASSFPASRAETPYTFRLRVSPTFS